MLKGNHSNNSDNTSCTSNICNTSKGNNDDDSKNSNAGNNCSKSNNGDSRRLPGLHSEPGFGLQQDLPSLH